MKILLITTGPGDFLTCQVVHGLYNILGESFTHSANYEIMYKNNSTKEQLLKLPGKGFTLHGTLNEYLNDNTDLVNKIKTKYFDKILIDICSVNDSLTDLALSTYSGKDIAYLDGEDIITTAPYYQSKFLGKIKYFKREKNDNDQRTYPIAYSIPIEKFSKSYTKTKLLANVVPTNGVNHIYSDEKEYYDDYGTSFFGLTTKKGGWDCLRHYEILANYCVPLFPNLELCHANTMFNFPKKEVITATNLYENFNKDEYYSILEFLYEYSMKNLTTINSAKYIITKLNEE